MVIGRRRDVLARLVAQRVTDEKALSYLDREAHHRTAMDLGREVRASVEKRKIELKTQQRWERYRLERVEKEEKENRAERRRADFRRMLLDYGVDLYFNGSPNNGQTTKKANNSRAASTANASEMELFEYLTNVYTIQSRMILWSKAGLLAIPSVITHTAFEIVQEINFSENNIALVPPSLLALPNLNRLFLHSNKIRKLPMLQAAAGSLSRSLQLLDLHNNLLSDLDISGFVELQVLDCEKNELREFPTGFEDCEKLQHLNLSYNLIKIVPATLGAFSTKKLNFLRLRNNPITNLPAYVYLRGMRATLEFLIEHTGAASFAAISRSDSLISDIEKSLLFNHFLSDISLQPSDDSKTSFHAHRCVLSARCKALIPVLANLPPIANEPHLPDTPKNTNVVVMKATAEELRMLLEYLYCDRFTAPKVELINLELLMGAAAISEANHINEQLLKSRRATLEAYVETAKRFDLPHLQMLIENVYLHAREPIESTFDTDMKAMMTMQAATHDISFRTAVDPATDLVHAHKAVIASRSEFLRAMLTGGMVESQQRRITLPDISPAIVKSIVEFCYTDDVEKLDPETVLELLITSKLYGLKRLQTIVESVVGYSLDVANVSSILSLSWSHSLKNLARACKFFILSHWIAVTSQPDWKEVEEPVRDKLVETAKTWKVI